ncbi:MAG: hypothetical protein PeribacterA2_1146 [Candidatus Peribacter riflensis]|uniref:Uncharacterized protein n=1 Tax=Candidatus Peribacter riflensis TaxID=1735162 RepID=A0A0S1SQK1_9BACT|nr:MAG: hypothetical protein PeribacterA2_1146 [Candidatus Peribacter riflensis]ALM11601.1 MAG: hypothetical protein PeribacterB2_1148 [Candidatus Peribacter riflensis]ALM12703.1 MAG: hypothetical protein PeribacterC2_1147 [Candidatus Peribacter riflensis]ALM13804.1 MAG: hypothetical protein PeribacterD1_1146 [Candidatus Peribacter riflensis]ALM14907.1 MAG: hypothetical protein PeribacterD2_1148 [Candidatus Peribacter riflensis]
MFSNRSRFLVERSEFQCILFQLPFLIQFADFLRPYGWRLPQWILVHSQFAE